MKLVQILILLAIVTYGYSTACTDTGKECAANECCSSLLCVSMLSNSVYTQTRTSDSSQNCLALGTKCAMTDTWIPGTPAAALCIDATTKQCRAVTSNYAYGIKAAADFTCVEVGTAKKICVDGTTKVALDMSTQTGTDYTAVYCMDGTTKACTKLQATAGTWDNGFKAADDWTCTATTTAVCVDPATLLTKTASASTAYCASAKKQCEPLTYSNTLPRYTTHTDFTCVATTTTTALCNSGVCKLSECCSSNACTAASATKCLTSTTSVACTDILTQVYSVSGDASCVALTTLTANVQCYDSTTKVIQTLTATSTKCVNTGSVCANLKNAAGTAEYTQTSATDFTCKAVETTTTTTTTTTTQSQINYIIGSLIILISFILI